MATTGLAWTSDKRLVWGGCLFLAAVVAGGLVRGEGLVGVLLTGPRVGTVGEQVAFEVELVNRSGQPLSQLRVIDYFDKGLRHPASASPIEQKGTVDLAAGTSRRLTLEFQLVEPGRQCHRVEILDQNNQSVGGGTACVEAVPANSPAAAAAGVGQQAGSSPQPPAGPAVSTGPPPVTGGAPGGVAAPPPTGRAGPGAGPISPAGPTASPPQVSSGAPPEAGFAPGAAATPPVTEDPRAAAPPSGAATGTAPPWQTGQDSPQPPQPDLLQPGEPASPPKSMPPNLAALATAPQSKAAFEVSLKGPADLSAGSVAEFVVTVRNIGNANSSAASLEVSWDPALTPLEASDGYTLGRDKASWSLPEIAAGGEASRQINFRGVASAASPADAGTRACVRTVLGGLPGGGMVADEACVVIRSGAPRPRTPQEAGLRVSLADLDDPVRFGSGTTLVCTISNDGDRPSGPLDLTISLPDQARIVGNPIPSRVRIDGPRVTFDGIASLPPGGRSTCELVYRMAGATTGDATVVVSGQELDGRLEAGCTTTFLGP